MDLGPPIRIGDVIREKIEPIDVGPSVPIARVIANKYLSSELRPAISIADVIAEKSEDYHFRDYEERSNPCDAI